ncbi:double-strand break repair protein AddB [Caulobacter sp. 17J80-11]|uniref:double-strand break repair protein AddB n=1 Tax=Caulobacter sp. 17J80-11 TaxID=2763502 RepID=UPI00351C75ED
MTSGVTPGGPFSATGPRWFTVSSHRPFVDDLASVLHASLAPLGPEALTDAIVLTPTRRGARALADAFVGAAGGRAVLLPQIRPVGDLDEGEPPFEPGDLALDLPPAVAPLRRRFELARLIVDHAPPEGRGELDAAAALEMADALAAFLDSAQIEERLDPDRIERLVEGDHAEHWRRSATFLAVATRKWPERLKELGLIDPTERRVRLLRRLAEQWDRNPPTIPLIAAGSTGTAPATADLLGVVARAPLGCVVLPGLDLDLADEAWTLVDEQHPQGAMKRLLDRHGVARDEVKTWPAEETEAERNRGRSRRRLVNEALRPAEATADWLQQIRKLQEEGVKTGVDPLAEGLQGLSTAAARTEEEAAAVAALLLREALETPGLTAALVTPDQALARRVSARLSRWGVEADSSAGAPLSSFPVGTLVALLAEILTDPLSPAALLGLLKHPLVRLGVGEGELARRRVALEEFGLRGPRPKTWTALQARLEKAADDARARGREARVTALAQAAEIAAKLQTAVETAIGPFAAGAAEVPEAATAFARALEFLARDAVGSTGSLWGGGGGETLAALLASLIEESACLPPAKASGFKALLETLIASETVRTGGATHPRLRVLGAIEARLIRADRLILAGLEEGVWPQGAPIDPFLSRPMRAALKLPPPERRIGLSAHDFAQAACAPEVILLTTERRGGQPAVPSRWLWRLETLAKGAGLSLPGRDDALGWARALDRPRAEKPRYAPRPKPTPPVDARPRALSVTRVERWVRDPYSIYADKVLRLKALDRPDAAAEARARGDAVHKALERLVQRWPEALPADADVAVETLLLDALAEYGFDGPAMAREAPLARNLARWIADFERRRRQSAPRRLIEQKGELKFLVEGREFTIDARADRIELSDVGAAVLDFKTGQAASREQVESGFAPQLTLTAAILAAGGFAEAGEVEACELTYVRLTGRRKPGEELTRAGPGEAAEWARDAFDGLMRRIRRFDDPATPYVSWAAPQYMGRYGGDYDHLARVWEWHVVGADGDEGGEG